ncbi:hypothetical protein DFJ63DRAFT_54144 [Scheffersomyces coipomensis]|uniref:uncharacterized protein n=1 Tax=Scheffersomyces coipomensis TaxID=1788519 RepID=UPI00315DEE34
MSSSRKTYSVYGITSIVAISGMLLGIESASLSNVLNSQSFEDYFTPLTMWEMIMVESGNAIVGCVLSGALYDNIGCIFTFQLAGILWIAGTIVVVFSPYIPLIVLGRCLKGASLGFISTGIPVYISETIPSKSKGRSMSMVQLSSGIGGLVMYFCNYYCQRYYSSVFFKYSWAYEGIPSVFLFIACFFLPESPKWLAYKSRWSEAAKSLNKIRNYNGLEHIYDEKLDEKDYVLRAYTAGPEIRNCTYGHIFGKKYWKHTFIGIITQVLVSLTAMGILSNYFIYVCEVCGVPAQDVQLFMSSQYIIIIVFTLFPIFLLDDCRRKDCLVFGFFILGIANLTIFIVAKVFGEPVEETVIFSPFDFDLFEVPASFFLAVFLFLYAIYAATIVSTSWLYIGEIFPVMARAKGSAVCMCAAWITNANLALFHPIIMEYVGIWIFMFTALSCIGGSLIFSTFPETRDLNEIGIESIFMDKIEQIQDVPDMDFLVSKAINDGMKQSKDLDYHHQNHSRVIPKEDSNDEDGDDRSIDHVIEVERELHDDEDVSDFIGDASEDEIEDGGDGDGEDNEPLTGGTPIGEPCLIQLRDSLSSTSLFTKDSKEENEFKIDGSNSPASETAVTAALETDYRPPAILRPVYHRSQRNNDGEKYKGVSEFINEYNVNTADNTSLEESYYSSDWFENVPPKISKRNNHKRLKVSPDSGNLFFHGNREGSPKKAGITYEPTAFLNYDTLQKNHKTSVVDESSDNNDSIPAIDKLNFSKPSFRIN